MLVTFTLFVAPKKELRHFWIKRHLFQQLISGYFVYMRIIFI